jgi:hypothetical protein
MSDKQSVNDQQDDDYEKSYDNIGNNLKNEILERQKKVSNKINNIKKNYKKLKMGNAISDSIEKQEVLNKFYDGEGQNLFEKILNQYDNDYKETTEEIAKSNLYDNIIANDLDPEIELAVSFYDRLIFIVVVVILRFLALYTSYYLIDTGFITTVKKAIYYYSIAYIIYFIIFVIIINIDIFRLRMMFNYLNMHINSTAIYSHIIITAIISYLIYLLILNISNDPIRKTITKTEKMRLKYKLSIITITFIVFLLVITVIL